MDHYNRYYDQQSAQDYDQYNLWQNSRFHNGFHLTQQWGESSQPSQDLESSDEGLSGEETKELSEIKVEQSRVISRSEMLEDPEPYCQMLFGIQQKEQQEEIQQYPSQHSGYDWTQASWKKGDTLLEPEYSGITFLQNSETAPRNPGTAPRNSKMVATNSGVSARPDNSVQSAGSSAYKSGVSKGNISKKDKKKLCVENNIQRRIMKAVSQPITISKATSMMERMGWKGGPLGKNSDGIAEPIAPDATYIAKKGFGLEERVQPKREKTKRDAPPNKRAKIAKKENKSHCKDKKHLSKQMKSYFITNALIQILEFVRNDREIEIEFDMKLTGMDRKIIHNTVQYIIDGTQEMVTIDHENEYHLGLLDKIQESNNYKLTTESDGDKKHRQLTLYKEAKEHMYLVTPDDLAEEDEEDNVTDKIDVESTDLSKANVKNTDTEEKVSNISDSGEIITKNDAEVSKMSINVTEINVIDRSESNNDILTQNDKVNKEENTNPFLKSIERIQHDVKENNLESDCLNTKIKSENCEKTEGLSVDNTVIDVEDRMVDRKNLQEHTAINNANQKTNVHEMNIASQKIDATKNNVQNTSTLNNVRINKCTKTEKDINNVHNNKKCVKKLSKNITNSLKEYFTEFLDEELYTEFRFLGPFDDKEMKEINKFLDNIYNCIYSGESNHEYKNILEKINGEELHYYEVKEDCNGSFVIYKCKTEDINT